eukprot:TRINITY_DN782123_c0_g1_i1.p1 TRINITY_DN782123_c0_g1~~TRINITY_DN782123_c0_g1_i1.p1  ORF type:complete len:317 (+),score=75.07 TRINITY_DN782123_c0_g1_i1:186-1136(+)
MNTISATNELERQLVAEIRRRESAENELSLANKRIETMSNERDEVLKINSTLENEVEIAKQKLKELTKTMKEEVAIEREHENDISKLRLEMSDYETLQIQNERLLGQIHELDSLCTKYQTQNNQLADTITVMKNQEEETGAYYLRTFSLAEDRLKDLSVAQSEVTNLKDQLQKREAEINLMKDVELYNLEEKVEFRESQVEQNCLKKENKHLNRKVSALKAEVEAYKIEACDVVNLRAKCSKKDEQIYKLKKRYRLICKKLEEELRKNIKTKIEGSCDKYAEKLLRRQLRKSYEKDTSRNPPSKLKIEKKNSKNGE